MPSFIPSRNAWAWNEDITNPISTSPNNIAQSLYTEPDYCRMHTYFTCSQKVGTKGVVRGRFIESEVVGKIPKCYSLANEESDLFKMGIKGNVAIYKG